MDFTTAVSRCFKKSFSFNGRARRSEYWYFFLFRALLFIAFYFSFVLLSAVPDPGFLRWILTGVFAAVFVWISLAGLAVFVRRLHDTEKSGWWFFLNFVPVLGNIVLLFWLAKDTLPFENEYGGCPK